MAEPTMYRLVLTHWDGVPMGRPTVPGPEDFQRFVDAAHERASGTMAGGCPLTSTSLNFLTRIKGAIVPEASGLVPRVQVFRHVAE